MALIFRYSDPRGIEEPAVSTNLGTEVLRYGKVALSESADVGEPSISTLEVDDPDGIWNFAGLRAFGVFETSAPSNNQSIWHGVIENRTVTRADSMRTGVARRWSIDLTDYNWVIGSRVFTDSDAKRPDETAGDRLRWLLNDAAHISLYDYGNVTYPSDQMEANDYRGQRASDLLADCAVETGYTFWCEYNEGHQRAELFFINPNGSSLSSTLKISNDYADWDGVVTFAPYEDAVLERSAARIAYGVYLAYANGAVYVRNTTTGNQFGKYDQTAPMSNVKHEARARRIATHFLNDNDEEDDTITCAIKVPAAQVNDIRVGRRLQCKFTHFPGYEDFTWMRVRHRTVVQEEEGGGHQGYPNDQAYYLISLDLTPTGVGGVQSCSTVLSNAVTVSLETQNYIAPGVTTYPITPISGVNSIILAGVIASNHNTPQDSNITGTNGFTTAYSHDVAGDAPDLGALYKAVVGASGSYDISTTYTPGFGPSSASRWTMAAAALRTSATSPVQSVNTNSSNGCSASLGAAPTAGNVLIMILAVREEREDDPVNTDAHLIGSGDWSTLAKGRRNRAAGQYDVVYVLAKCVDTGDTAGPWGIAGTSQGCAMSLQEWALT